MSEVTHIIRECGAKMRTNNYQPCRCIATSDGKCRLHGGLTPVHNPGPKTEEGKQRQRMANWKHGICSKEVIAEKRAVAKLIRETKMLLD